MEIVDGIHIFDGIRGANSYLYSTANVSLIIDTGMPGNTKRIIEQILKLKQPVENIKMIVLTHSDIDHSGSAAELKRLTGAKVAIHEKDAPRFPGNAN